MVSLVLSVCILHLVLSCRKPCKCLVPLAPVSFPYIQYEQLRSKNRLHVSSIHCLGPIIEREDQVSTWYRSCPLVSWHLCDAILVLSFFISSYTSSAITIYKYIVRLCYKGSWSHYVLSHTQILCVYFFSKAVL